MQRHAPRFPLITPPRRPQRLARTLRSLALFLLAGCTPDQVGGSPGTFDLAHLQGPDGGPDGATAACPPGQGRSDGGCSSDCRLPNAVPCAAPLVCDYTGGQCQDAATACTLTGDLVPCGEFARCGPGSMCQGNACVATSQCTQVLCDITGVCRGGNCTVTGGGGIHSLTLSPLAPVSAGQAGALRPDAMLTADGLCGLTVSFEVRHDTSIFVSAFGDKAIWQVPFSGTATKYLQEATAITGLTADTKGTLYYILPDFKQVKRVDTTGAQPVGQVYSTVSAASGTMARMVFGPDGLLYLAANAQVFRIDATGAATTFAAAPVENFLSGLVFDRDGALILGSAVSGASTSHKVYRLPTGATTAVPYVQVASLWTGATSPWDEGMALSPDGLVRVGVFPSSNTFGLIYQIEQGGSGVTKVADLASMQRDVPQVTYTGVHGLAYGSDGTLYFANQNTSGNTGESRGQVLGLRPSGKVELIFQGLDLDWANGFDGDVVVAQQVVETGSARVVAPGAAVGALDAPALPGTYVVRALATDPRTGAIFEARQPVVVQ